MMPWTEIKCREALAATREALLCHAKKGLSSQRKQWPPVGAAYTERSSVVPATFKIRKL